MKIKPLNVRVLVLQSAEEEVTSGGIIIPDTAKEKPLEGKVIATGPGYTGKDGTITPLEVKPGDRVLFSKYAGTEVTVNGVKHLFMREDEILCIIE